MDRRGFEKFLLKQKVPRSYERQKLNPGRLAGTQRPHRAFRDRNKVTYFRQSQELLVTPRSGSHGHGIFPSKAEFENVIWRSAVVLC